MNSTKNVLENTSFQKDILEINYSFEIKLAVIINFPPLALILSVFQDIAEVSWPIKANGPLKFCCCYKHCTYFWCLWASPSYILTLMNIKVFHLYLLWSVLVKFCTFHKLSWWLKIDVFSSWSSLHMLKGCKSNSHLLSPLYL